MVKEVIRWDMAPARIPPVNLRISFQTTVTMQSQKVEKGPPRKMVWLQNRK